jgi:hypothetical protein
MELALQIVGPEVFAILPVPLGTLSPVPLPLALGACAGHLTILEPTVGHEPSPAHTAWTLLGYGCFVHRLLQLSQLRENDSKPLCFSGIPKDRSAQTGPKTGGVFILNNALLGPIPGDGWVHC